jgi:hypothetical protein
VEVKPKAVRKAAAHKPVKRTPREPAVERAAAPAPAFHPHQFRAEIAEQAYYYWLERQGAPGDERADWLRAEAEIRRRWELAHRAR